MMKTQLLSLALLLTSTFSAADVDPLVSEYQTLDALNKNYPQIAQMVIAVNGGTATLCETVFPLSELLKYEAFNSLGVHVSKDGVLEDTAAAHENLHRAVRSLCLSLFTSEILTESQQSLSSHNLELFSKGSDFSSKLETNKQMVEEALNEFDVERN
ncbi:hypothetical protein OCT63_20760 [Vibrio sp. RW]|uniref:hypothetical protein n=1 Tax=Vibrio sp. RW TaxID=2998833 RepID=UPI0022CD5D5A|nr:hypothetical protein [Vibrio sp. RW]MDA0146647.1 hypothetical protein [Vibrio sp. RW]